MAEMIEVRESFPEPQFFHTDQSVVCHKRREICEHFSLDQDNNEVSHGDNRALSAQNLTESSSRKIKSWVSIVPSPPRLAGGGISRMQIEY